MPEMSEIIWYNIFLGVWGEVFMPLQLADINKSDILRNKILLNKYFRINISYF